MISTLLRRYEQQAPQQEMKFLASLIFNLSMVARDSYAPGQNTSGLLDSDRGRAFNEMIHRTSAQLLQLLGFGRSYPTETFFKIILETAEPAGCKDDLFWAIESSFREAAAPASA